MFPVLEKGICTESEGNCYYAASVSVETDHSSFVCSTDCI
jgi:hypothetical protein